MRQRKHLWLRAVLLARLRVKRGVGWLRRGNLSLIGSWRTSTSGLGEIFDRMNQMDGIKTCQIWFRPGINKRTRRIPLKRMDTDKSEIIGQNLCHPCHLCPETYCLSRGSTPHWRAFLGEQFTSRYPPPPQFIVRRGGQARVGLAKVLRGSEQPRVLGGAIHFALPPFPPIHRAVVSRSWGY